MSSQGEKENETNLRNRGKIQQEILIDDLRQIKADEVKH